MPLALIDESTIAMMSADGDNAFGLKEEDAPSAPAELGTHLNIVNKSVDFPKSKGKDHPYLYLNYASQSQDVMASYGEENLQRLKQISQR
ncbi:hypothetical protein EJ03DRAFT_347455 [Teratosphaeria nubilosa]|uniref:Uncharacterized protein n=1 Tax=Teratosphaeria nubilosa TaxID=161662 RepID=A0A6G1LMA8_9PEZI|nr:hypothetical protein EJ03DRAFT_347455 [Teratosphaeria nubilosa]